MVVLFNTPKVSSVLAILAVVESKSCLNSPIVFVLFPKSRAIFGKEKLDWTNAEYIRKKSPDELLALVKPIASARGYTVSDDYLKRVIHLMQERARSTFDFIDFARYFFTAPTEFDEKSKAKNWTLDAKERMIEILTQFKSLPEWMHDSIEAVIRSYAESKAISAGKLIHPLRLAVSGVGMGPGLFEMLEVIGKEEVCKRLDYALVNLN